MIDASQWAKNLREDLRTSIQSDPEIGTGFMRRAEEVIRRAQLDAINQCLRITHQQMNGAPRQQRLGMGLVVDKVADLALDVKQRVTPKQGDG